MKIMILGIFLFPITLFGMEQVTQEYPELINFFNSTVFQEQMADCHIYIDHQKTNTIASMSLSFGNNGFVKILHINAHYINRTIFDPEEFKFILCHELGHAHDKSLIKTGFSLLAGLSILNTGLFFSLKNSLQKTPHSLLKKISTGYAVLFSEYLLCMKFMRDRELYADAYSIAMTGNKDAALSALRKRKCMVGKIDSRYGSLNTALELLRGHPNEENRIDSIEKMNIYDRPTIDSAC